MYSTTERKRSTRERAARRPDKYTLYQRSVQDPDAEVNFFTRVFRNMRGRTPLILREDFCGTALVSCEWVRRGVDRRAFAIDLHEPTLQWGRRNNVAPLGRAASRVELICGNVLDTHPVKADVAALIRQPVRIRVRQLLSLPPALRG